MENTLFIRQIISVDDPMLEDLFDQKYIDRLHVTVDKQNIIKTYKDLFDQKNLKRFYVSDDKGNFKENTFIINSVLITWKFNLNFIKQFNSKILNKYTNHKFKILSSLLEIYYAKCQEESCININFCSHRAINEEQHQMIEHNLLIHFTESINLPILELVFNFVPIPCMSDVLRCINKNASRSSDQDPCEMQNQLDLVKFFIWKGSLMDHHTLRLSIETNNVEIIFQLLVHGAGKLCYCCENSNFDKSLYWILFIEIYVVRLQIFNNDNFNKIINLFVCSGIKITEKLYKHFKNLKIKSFLRSKIILCYKAMNPWIYSTNIKKINLEIDELKKTTGWLIEGSMCEKQIPQQSIYDFTNFSKVIVEIIHGYLSTKSQVDFIDWDSKKRISISQKILQTCSKFAHKF